MGMDGVWERSEGQEKGGGGHQGHLKELFEEVWHTGRQGAEEVGGGAILRLRRWSRAGGCGGGRQRGADLSGRVITAPCSNHEIAIVCTICLDKLNSNHCDSCRAFETRPM